MSNNTPRSSRHRLATSAAKFAVLVLAIFGAVSLVRPIFDQDAVAVWYSCGEKLYRVESGCLKLVLATGSNTDVSLSCSRTNHGETVGVACVPLHELRLLPGQAVRATVPPGASKMRVSFFHGPFNPRTHRGTKVVEDRVDAEKLHDDLMDRGSRFYEFKAPSQSGPSQYAEVDVWNGSDEQANFAFRFRVSPAR